MPKKQKEQEIMHFPLNGGIVEIAWPFTPFGKALDQRLKELEFFLGAKCININDGDIYGEYTRFYGIKKDDVACENFGIKYTKEFSFPFINTEKCPEMFTDIMPYIYPDYADKITFVNRENNNPSLYMSKKTISKLLLSSDNRENISIQIDGDLKIKFEHSEESLRVEDASIDLDIIGGSSLSTLVDQFKKMKTSYSTLTINTFLNETLPFIVKEITEKGEQHLNYEY